MKSLCKWQRLHLFHESISKRPSQKGWHCSAFHRQQAGHQRVDLGRGSPVLPSLVPSKVFTMFTKRCVTWMKRETGSGYHVHVAVHTLRWGQHQCNLLQGWRTRWAGTGQEQSGEGGRWPSGGDYKIKTYIKWWLWHPKWQLISRQLWPPQKPPWPSGPSGSQPSVCFSCLWKLEQTEDFFNDWNTTALPKRRWQVWNTDMAIFHQVKPSSEQRLTVIHWYESSDINGLSSLWDRDFSVFCT